MILHIFSIRDSAANSYGRPFFLPSAGVALRTFGDEVNRAAIDNPMYQHPEDFELYALGTFDDSTAEFSLCTRPELLARAKDYVIDSPASK